MRGETSVLFLSTMLFIIATSKSPLNLCFRSLNNLTFHSIYTHCAHRCFFVYLHYSTRAFPFNFCC